MTAILFTREGALVEVEQVWVVSGKQDENGNWIQQGGKVAKLPNGSFCHGDLLPFNSEEEITLIFTTRDREGNPMIIPEFKWLLDEVLEWFARRHEIEGEKIQKIMFDANGWPELEDGTPVTDEAVIYQCCKPGPVMTAAIIGLNERRQAEAIAAKAAKPDFYRQEPTPPPGMPRVAGDLVATPKEPEKAKSPARGRKPGGRKAGAKGGRGRAASKPMVNPTPAQPAAPAAG
jgi:hypothetical protein